jgi:hypothetical protein
MLVQFNDVVKGIELEVVELDVVPVVKDHVVIRDIIYIVVQRLFDFANESPVCRLSCEIRV